MREIISFKVVDYPQEYFSDYIYTYPTFNNELQDLLEQSGYVGEFTKKYFRGLRFLENLKERCTAQSKLFERLRHGYGFYSMQLHGRKNIRILFDFHKVSEKSIVVLYVCFEEKRSGDYANEITVAIERRKELIGE